MPIKKKVLKRVGRKVLSRAKKAGTRVKRGAVGHASNIYYGVKETGARGVAGAYASQAKTAAKKTSKKVVRHAKSNKRLYGVGAGAAGAGYVGGRRKRRRRAY